MSINSESPEQPEALPYLDTSLPFEARVDDLVARMTLDEKISQMVHEAPAIPRLGIPKYNWWNECLHGVGRAGIATVFPQAIGLAATWNTALMSEVAQTISDEARAKHHDAIRRGVHDIYYGLTFWSPNINIFRDPRWGRGQETYGEDPFLTARMGLAFVRGLQDDHPRYLKLVATPKHFAVHSGPEADRHHFNAKASPRDMWDTYLPAFEACVREGGAYSVMGAYNRTNDEPCCASPTLLERILRQRWGFQGYVVSDCWAIEDIYKHHQVADSLAAASAMAVKAGCDLSCSCAFETLTDAVRDGLIDEANIDQAVKRLFLARFRLGMFDPPAQVPYTRIPIEVNDSPEHKAMAARAARESIVLLKNEGGCLPLGKDVKTIAVIGPNADDRMVLLGNYNGTPSSSVTPLEGIRAAAAPGTTVLYARGCHIRGSDTSGYAEALDIARQADVIIFFGGLSQLLEGEEGQVEGAPEGETSQGDRTTIELEKVQEDLLKALHATGKPVVLVLLNGSAIAIEWAAATLPAIVEAWYPGQAAGTAIADVLFGMYNPAGRLPVTFYRATSDLPPFEDYRMAGRTYRYFEGEPLYPFGHGLSYTTFAYADLSLSATAIDTARLNDGLTISVTVQNTGEHAGDEVVQLYVTALESPAPAPRCALQGFTRLHLAQGAAQQVSFKLTARHLSIVDESGQRLVAPGRFAIFVGGGQPGHAAGLRADLTVTGAPLHID